ncbi:helix-turn-helix domain-containing protein [Arthrobacter sp. 35W]|uniref:helix-turn-helix domain-containing protein n=1 Tax=Arthrobacter sp. 35W TaxID=1132441 RepID=UPI0003FF3AB6|nr:helix-turn-helix domain-containing protein [Arthrobacter sp. 35W]
MSIAHDPATAITTEPVEDQWLTPKDICRLLQIPEQTFYQWRVKHTGPRAHRIGRHLRISRADFNAWLASTEDDQI